MKTINVNVDDVLWRKFKSTSSMLGSHVYETLGEALTNWIEEKENKSEVMNH